MQISAFKHLIVLFLLTGVTACGFHLRTLGELPFESIYVQGSGAPGISRELRRLLIGSGVKVVSNPEDAQALLELMSEQNEKRILSLAGKGTVSEYDVFYRVTFRVKKSATDNWGPPQLVEQHRDFSYDNSAVLAKDAEEARLVSDMHSEVVHEILRRVGTLTKQAAATQ